MQDLQGVPDCGDTADRKNVPRVTIVIPVYNAEKHIVETLDSAFAQTYPNLDVVCVDDCSTDHSVAVLEKYKEDRSIDPDKLKILQLEKNSGPSVARNKGIASASGIYIMPLDADDKIAETYIEKAIRLFLSKPDIAVVYCEASTIGDEAKPYAFPSYDPEIMAVRNLVFSSGVFRKEDWSRYGGYNENMRRGLEDWDFWLKFTEEGRMFHRINETLFFYRKHGESRSDDAIRHYDSLRKQIRKNHPSLYGFRAILGNKHLRKELSRKIRRPVKNARKWLIHVRFRKNEKIVRIFGIYLLHKLP